MKRAHFTWRRLIDTPYFFLSLFSSFIHYICALFFDSQKMTIVYHKRNKGFSTDGEHSHDNFPTDPSTRSVLRRDGQDLEGDNEQEEKEKTKATMDEWKKKESKGTAHFYLEAEEINPTVPPKDRLE